MNINPQYRTLGAFTGKPEAKRVSHSYFVVMCDYGQRGLEAIVHPEDTRRAVVEQLASGESKHVVFIHHVDGLYIEDVTDELFNEAEATIQERQLIDSGGKPIASARYLPKHEVV
jgi:hypothetical protein